MESFQFAKTLSEGADHDIQRGELVYVMMKYKAMANSFIVAYKIAPPEYKDSLS